MTLLSGLLLAAAQAATLSGVVVAAEDGSPLQGVSVQAYDARLQGLDALTDADGRFEIDDVAPGRWRVRAVPGYSDNRVTRWLPDAAEFCDSAPVDVASDGATVGGLELRLPEGAGVTGRLLDSGGEPAPSAIVWTVGLDGSTNGLASRPGVTDSDGRFQIVGVDAPLGEVDGDWQLYVQAEGYPDQFLGPAYDQDDAPGFTLAASGSTDVGEHALLDGILVTGTVTGPDGPVEDGDVRVYAGGQVVNVRSDADGRYVAVGLPPGDVLPWVNADGIALTYWPDADRPTEFLSAPEEGAVVEDADLQPPGEAVLSFLLIDPATGAPISDLQGLLYNDTRTVGLGDVTDEAGVLAIDSLHGGDYQLYVYGDRYGSVNGWIRGADGEPRVFSLADGAAPAPIELTLEPAGSLSGAVTDDQGAPLYGVTVVAREVVPDGVEGAVAAVLTEPDGSFRLGGLPVGAFRLEAGFAPLCPSEPGYVTTFWPDTPNVAWASDLTLDRPEAITDLTLRLAVDADGDAMADTWEETHGLEPWRDDSLEDPDGDEYVNLTEFLLDTDPMAGPDARCGCGGRASVAWLGPLLLLAGLRRRER